MSQLESRTRLLFRVVAVAEAISWAGLLAAMFHKYVVAGLPFSADHRGVAIAGMIHGGVFFLAFVVMSVVAWRVFDWRLGTLALALVSAVPPFATIWFERRVDRQGLLGVTAAGRTPAGAGPSGPA